MLNEEQDLLPVEQQTLTFYGKPIVVVRLPDGQPGVVLRFLCENLQIDTAAQTQRIRRTEAISEDLILHRSRLTAALKKWRCSFCMPFLSGWRASILNEYARRFARKSCVTSARWLMSS